MLRVREQGFLLLCRKTAGLSHVTMLTGGYWGQRSGTRITLGYVDPSLTRGATPQTGAPSSGLTYTTWKGREVSSGGQQWLPPAGVPHLACTWLHKLKLSASPPPWAAWTCCAMGPLP